MAKAPTYKGSTATLLKHKTKTWRGWAIYSWDHGVRVGLFDRKPKVLYDRGEKWAYDWDGVLTEDVNGDFLQACGVDIPFDVMGEEGKAFYYGEGCLNGDHPPVRIELTLPEPILEQLRLI